MKLRCNRCKDPVSDEIAEFEFTGRIICDACHKECRKDILDDIPKDTEEFIQLFIPTIINIFQSQIASIDVSKIEKNVLDPELIFKNEDRLKGTLGIFLERFASGLLSGDKCLTYLKEQCRYDSFDFLTEALVAMDEHDDHSKNKILVKQKLMESLFWMKNNL